MLVVVVVVVIRLDHQYLDKVVLAVAALVEVVVVLAPALVLTMVLLPTLVPPFPSITALALSPQHR